jgi:sugar O-acyltransferase (sialic acid O-acetyltransferase NeuD family)
MLVAVGYKNMKARAEMFDKAKAKGYSMINHVDLIYVRSFRDLKMGDNNIIFGGAYLSPRIKLGDNNIIRPNSYVGHDVEIGSHNFIGPGVTILGKCKIENFCFIGAGSTILNNTVIAEGSIVGAGAVIIENTQKSRKYVGNPGKEIRYRSK